MHSSSKVDAFNFLTPMPGANGLTLCSGIGHPYDPEAVLRGLVDKTLGCAMRFSITLKQYYEV